MKLKFKSNLDYQNKAIKSIVDIFDGQKQKTSQFTVLTGKTLRDEQIGIGEVFGSVGIGNRLELSKEEILSNVRKVQERNNLQRSEKLEGMNFTVEMETGTGKTYVYLRTIYELNKRYGFKKFVVVVPSVAIREGVDTSIRITKDHFDSLYDNEPMVSFIYNSNKLESVREFATSNSIQIMIINIDAFRKGFEDPLKEDKANIIHRKQDKLNGQRPIDLIKETNPIVIIDEPQSVDTTDKSKEAIASLNPMCTLRYSATHVDKYNMVYRLDAVDAYEQRLVKKIEVLSVRSDESFNKPYIKLIKVDENKKATIEIDEKKKDGSVKRSKKVVKSGEDLYDKSGQREIYYNQKIENIICGKEKYIIINGKKIYNGNAIGDIDDDKIKKFQIRKTIEEHLEKEIRLNKKGIKVLSLFFIDKVANYREYDKDGTSIPGKYAKMFEEEYEDLIKQDRFKKNINRNISVGSTHKGYFAIDKKRFKESRENKPTKADEEAYKLIMKDKEKLLDMSNDLRFIFSHSALREGWDNPNVFQICTLKDSSGTEVKRRQEIGRGLRLCVNQEGERIHDDSVNVLTVMANESYFEFVKSLQNELQNDTGIKFGTIEKNSFANIKKYDLKSDKDISFGYDKSEEFYEYLKNNDYIDKNGKIQDKLKEEVVAYEKDDKDNKKFSLKETKFQDFFVGIISELSKRCKSYEIKDASKKEKVKLNKIVVDSEEFTDLWKKISTKTIYNVDFDSEELIKKCVDEIKYMDKIESPKLIARKDKIDISRGAGVVASGGRDEKEDVHSRNYLPDIITELQNNTDLTRKTIIDILIKSERLEDFKQNPQKFIETVTKIINKEKSYFVTTGIKYEKTDDSYPMEKFTENEETILAYLNDKSINSKKSPFNHTICDSEVELSFAKKFENDPRVKVYVKLPNWFKIDTPVGKYNVDWALVMQKDGQDKLYFVIETKGTEDLDELRPLEKAKIKCAKKHFEAITSDVVFKAPVSKAEKFMLSI